MIKMLRRCYSSSNVEFLVAEIVGYCIWSEKIALSQFLCKCVDYCSCLHNPYYSCN